MPAISRKQFRKSVFWLTLCAGLLAFCVQSGELGSADTMHRLQTAHSFWTSQPAVFPNEYPEFGVHGRGGKLYDWYGIGQPLLLLPFDIVGTGISKLPVFSDYGDTDPTVRNIFVTYSVNALVNVLTALICYRFLLLLGFDETGSIAGVLALLFCTTHLHYTQNMMENNYIMLLTMTGFCFQFEWLRSGSQRALLIGSGALGLNLLTRLTTGLDLIAAGAFLLLVLLIEGSLWQEFWPRCKQYLTIAVPIYVLFFFFDRLYQFYRFGNWTTTYVHYFTIEHRLQDPTLPAKYPWETPFHVGFLGALISPEKSIFLFDPLIVLTILVSVMLFARKRATVPTGLGSLTEVSPALKRWANIDRPFGASVTLDVTAVKAYVISSLLLVLAYIVLYARYTVWSGNFAWGDRYVSTAVEMAAFVSVPLLLKFRAQLGKPVRVLGIVLIVGSLVIQLASLAFWLPLEIYQMEDLGSKFVIGLRFKNIVAFALEKMDTWGLNTDAMGYDQWDYQHITTWNFLPFVLRRIGAAPSWVVDVAFAAWWAALAALLFCMVELYRNVVDFYHEPEY